MRLSLRRIEFSPSSVNHHRSTNKSLSRPSDNQNSSKSPKDSTSSNSSSSNESNDKNLKNYDGAIIRRKRHRGCKTKSSWINHSRTIHPRKSTKCHKPAIENLMKLIIEQGETIQQQLTQLR